MPGDAEEGRRDRGADPLGDAQRVLRRRLREQDRELLAAEAGRHVVGAERLLEDVRDALQHRVPGEVPVAVVDVALKVEVGDEHGERSLEALGALDLLVKGGLEVARVVEARLRIEPCLHLELRDAQRPVDQDERRDREDRERRRPIP